MLLACGTEDPGARFTVRVRMDDGGSTSYRAVLVLENGAVEGLSCPGDATTKLRCENEGFEIEHGATPVELTLKAPGYASLTHALSPKEAGRRALELTLARLAEFERTATYASGLGAADGAETFAVLAFSDHTELGEALSLKFYIEGLDGEPRVYFADTRTFPRHIDFVKRGLGRPVSDAAFEAMTHGPDRSAMVGTLVSRPELRVPYGEPASELVSPVTLEFFPSDDLTAEQALLAHRLLEERMPFLAFDGDERRLVYVPSGTRAEGELESARTSFDRVEARYARFTQLYPGIREQILNPGLAYGTLRRLSPEDLDNTVISRHDLLLLTRLPNDLPLAAGTITEELQTPLAHVNLAARARGTPNLALLGASEDPRVAPFVDALVRFEVTDSGFSLAEASLEEASAHWESEVREVLVPECDPELDGLPSLEDLGFGDAARVGVKAANLGELRFLGERAPFGFAVPFSAFATFMQENQVTAPACAETLAQCGASGRAQAACDGMLAVCDAAAQAEESYAAYVERLVADAGFRANTELREASLFGLRALIEDGTVDEAFGETLDARVLEVFGDAKVRLRSSTNVEDLPEFSGAGLYESVTAEAAGERRASNRIRRVWASTYTFAAFEERSLWNVQESGVCMGVAVNQAFGTELANGVIITQNLSEPSSPGFYVNVQLGELPVVNPENGATPEILTLVPAGDAFEVVRQRYSSESPERALVSTEEANELAGLASEIEAHFAPFYGRSPSELALDLEFKFLPPDRSLVVKQARPYFDRGAR